MIIRDIQNLLKEMMKAFPIVTVTGPRQSGKTSDIRSPMS